MDQPLFLFLDGGESETQPTPLDVWRPVPQSTEFLAASSKWSPEPGFWNEHADRRGLALNHWAWGIVGIWQIFAENKHWRVLLIPSSFQPCCTALGTQVVFWTDEPSACNFPKAKYLWMWLHAMELSRLLPFLSIRRLLCFTFLYVVTVFTLMTLSKGSPRACGCSLEPRLPFCLLLFNIFYIFTFCF